MTEKVTMGICRYNIKRNTTTIMLNSCAHAHLYYSFSVTKSLVMLQYLCYEALT